VTIFPFKIIVLEEEELYALALSHTLSLSHSKVSFIIGHANCSNSKLTSGMSKGIAIVSLFRFPQLFGDGSLKF
jgi:hypothetical protein